MARVLLKAATYRKFWFPSEDDLVEYLDSGHLDRWLVSKEQNCDGAVVAIIGEQYNHADELKMEREVVA